MNDRCACGATMRPGSIQCSLCNKALRRRRSFMVQRHLTLTEVLGHVERPVEGGEKAPQLRLQKRMVVDGERTYAAYSADELIALTGWENRGRPGMPY